MESTTATKNPVLIYTEQTPNPESLKFVTNKMLYAGTADFRTREVKKLTETLSKRIDPPDLVDSQVVRF